LLIDIKLNISLDRVQTLISLRQSKAMLIR